LEATLPLAVLTGAGAAKGFYEERCATHARELRINLSTMTTPGRIDANSCTLGENMKYIAAIAMAVIIGGIAVAAPPKQGQMASGSQPAIKEQLAKVKQSVMDNRTQLQKYHWLETTVVSVKGDSKKDEQKACRYAADGNIEKTPLGWQDAPKDMPGGLRGKVAKKKIGEMQDYMERLKGLISHYVPPNPEMMQNSFQAGKVNLNMSSGGLAELTFRDYYKGGDSITLGFDTASSRITSYNITSYLDGPEDVVTMANQFSSLPSNITYLQQTILTSKSKQIEIKTTNSQYELNNPNNP
jgi:hypothetical protein